MQTERQVVAGVLVAIAFLLSGCGDWDYDITVVYICLSFSGTSGLCSQWQQKGEIKVPYAGCFPGDAMVMGEAGPVAMQDLSIGDRVLGLDAATGLPQYSSVRGWLHRGPSQVMNMVEIRTEGGGKLVASPGHMLAVASLARAADREHVASSSCPHSVARYIRASHLRPGDVLVSPSSGASMNATMVTVESTRIGQKEGLYAPLTWQSNFFVAMEPMEPPAASGESVGSMAWKMGDKSVAESSAAFTRLADATQSLPSMVLAHSFANIAEPQRYEATWHRLLTIADLVLPSAVVTGEDGTTSMPEGYVHPLARLMMRLLGAAPIEPLLFEGELDVVVDAASGRRRLEARRLSSSGNSNDQDWVMFFLSVLQTTILPPWMANPPLAPNPRLNDINRAPLPADDDDDSGITPALMSVLWTITVICCCCACLACMTGGAGAATVQANDDERERYEEESRPLTQGDPSEVPPILETQPPQNYYNSGGPYDYPPPGPPGPPGGYETHYDNRGPPSGYDSPPPPPGGYGGPPSAGPPYGPPHPPPPPPMGSMGPPPPMGSMGAPPPPPMPPLSAPPFPTQAPGPGSPHSNPFNSTRGLQFMNSGYPGAI